MRRGIVQDDQGGLGSQVDRIGPADSKVGRRHRCVGKMVEEGFHVVDNDYTMALKMRYARSPGGNFGASIVCRGEEAVERSQHNLLPTLRSKGMQGGAVLADGTAAPAPVPGSFVCVGDGDGSLLIEWVELGCDVDVNLWIARRSLKV